MVRTENQRELPRWLFIAVALSVAARIGVSFIPQKQEPEAKGEASLVRWFRISDAKGIAAQSHKRILYEFSAAWCGPCKIMEREVFNNPRLAARINNELVPVRVVDRQQEDGSNSDVVETLQRTYQVRAFPTVVIAEVDGAALMRREGYEGARAFEALLDATRAPH